MTKAPYSVTGRPKREGSQSNRPKKSNLMRSLTALALGGALLLGGQAVSAQEDVKDCNGSTPPCFANNPDILSGRRHLLRADDLVISVDHEFLNGNTTDSRFENYLLLTDDEQINEQISYDMVTAKCSVEPPAPAPINTRIGRVFNLKNDVVVSLAPKVTATGTNCTEGVGELALYIHDPSSLTVANASITELGFSPDFTRMAMDDFDYDGFADIVLIGPFFQKNYILMEVYAARDVDDPSGGMLFQTSLNLGDSSPTLPRGEPVTGDFNGDGAIDVAWIGGVDKGTLSISFASICPAAGVEVLNTTCSAPFEIVRSKETIRTGLVWTQDRHGNFPSSALTAGDFDGTANPVTGLVNDELLFLHKTELTSSNAKLLIRAYNFTPDLAAIEPPSSLTLKPIDYKSLNFGLGSSHFHAASGRLDWTASREQVVVAASAMDVPSFLSQNVIYTINFSTKDGKDLSMTTQSTSSSNDGFSSSIYGVAIGRFDPPDVNGKIDFNQQIAVLLQEVEIYPDHPNVENTEVDIYTVDPSAKSEKDRFIPELVSNRLIANELLFSNEHRVHSPLQVGDLQGNSLALGAPTVVKIAGHIEPSIVLGVPPMHADFIREASEAQASIVNVSIAPSESDSTSEVPDFSATYKFATSSDTSTTHQSKTSTALSTKETIQGKVTFGLAKIDSLTTSFKVSAKQTEEKVVAAKHVFKMSVVAKEQATTGLGDLVWYSVKDFYIYIYPVIGRTVCPIDAIIDIRTRDCADADKVPMTVQFSGPDEIQTFISEANNDLMVMQGHNMEWYQPVHEPGNLLTYPWNEALLKNRIPEAQGLANPNPQTQTPGTDPQDQGTTWSTGSSSTQSTGSTTKNTEKVGVSIAAKGTIGVDSFSAKASFDFKGSKSVSTLTTSVATVAESEGIEVSIPAFDDPSTWSISNFEYDMATFLFGQEVPEGTLDVSSTLTDLSTSGIQQTRFVATATDDNWLLAYNLPDLALNHPQRWSWDDVSLTLTFNWPNLVDVDTSRFHALRGFFVTPQDDTAVTPVGPMFTQLTAGDVFTLWTRIYNMSLAPFKDGDMANVRIFGQVFDSTSPSCQETNPPDNCQFVGPSFEVANQIFDATLLASYPDQDSFPTTTPNWRYIKQDWGSEPDPGHTQWGCGPVGAKQSCAGKEIIFWVLVWPERDGALVPEMVGHGLGQIPSGNTLNNISDVPLEMILYENNMRTFSNNVGLYNQTFFVCGAAHECDPGSDAFAASDGVVGDLIVHEVRFDSKTVDLHDSVRVEAHFGTTDQPFTPINVFFYDGAPNDGDRMPFDHEHIPFVGSNNKYVTSSRFEPRTCGLQEIHVVMAAIGGPPVTDSSMIEVTADPVVEVGLIMDSVKRFEISRKIELSLLENLAHAQKDFRKDLTSDATRHLNTFSDQVRTQTGGKIPLSSGQSLIAQVDRLMGCLG